MRPETHTPFAAEADASVQQRLASLRDSTVDTLVIGAPDLNCEFRAKRFALDLFTREEVEIAFSDYVFSADIAEELMTPRSSFNGYFPTAASGLPDIFVHPDWDLLRVLPWDPRTALVLGDWFGHDGEPLGIAPRHVLQRVIARIERLGYVPMVGSEYEFFVFKGHPERVRVEPSTLAPLSTGAAYGHTRGAADEPVLGHVRRMINDAGIPVEAANPEASPGQNEITIRYSDGLRAADNAFLYKHFVRELLAAQDLTASFIAKTGTEGYGSSGHLHLSLNDRGGAPAMTDPDGALSPIAFQAIAGFLTTMSEFTAFYAPFVNSYRRYQADYSFAGDTVAWGRDNRTCGLRVIHTTPGATRLESRVPGADMNPYVATAATLAAIGHGIEQGLDAPPDVPGDAYTHPGIARVPNDLRTAALALEQSEVARDWLGDEFVDFYVESRLWDADQHRLVVTDWELARYL